MQMASLLRRSWSYTRSENFHRTGFHTPIKFTQRLSLFARFAWQNRERHFANFSVTHALARLELRLT
jgi:hypothetical protein